MVVDEELSKFDVKLVQEALLDGANHVGESIDVCWVLLYAV